MQKKHLTTVLLIFLMTSTPSLAKPVNLSLLSASELTVPDPSKGYLLIELDTDGTSPAIVFKQLSSKQRYLSRNQPRKKLTTAYIITTKNKENGLYLVPLSKGLYQITTVKVPFFNLPYRLTTDKQRQWAFHIEQGYINYIGKLTIAKTRSTASVDIKLLNRLANDQDKINQQLIHLLANIPLVSGMGYRDDFLTSFSSKSRGK